MDKPRPQAGSQNDCDSNNTDYIGFGRLSPSRSLPNLRDILPPLLHDGTFGPRFSRPSMDNDITLNCSLANDGHNQHPPGSADDFHMLPPGVPGNDVPPPMTPAKEKRKKKKKNKSGDSVAAKPGPSSISSYTRSKASSAAPSMPSFDDLFPDSDEVFPALPCSTSAIPVSAVSSETQPFHPSQASTMSVDSTPRQITITADIHAGMQ